MKIKINIYIKLWWYFKIYRLMGALYPHITDKDAVELIDYWRVVYMQKISRLLSNESKRLFG